MIDNYYKKVPHGQKRSITTHVNAGLNKFSSANMISDDHLADMYEARLNTANDGIILGSTTYSTTNYPGAWATGSGSVLAMIADDSYIHLVTYDETTGDNGAFEDWFVISGSALATNDISSYGLSRTAVTTNSWSGSAFFCRMKTQAKTYICLFSTEQKKMLVYDYTNFISVTLPFYPTAAVAHAERIFAIDDGNTIWWCRAGDPFSWYGLEADDDKIVTLTNMANGTYSIAAQPDNPRPLTFTVVKQSTVDTFGTVAVVGTNSIDAAISETITLVDGTRNSSLSYKTVTSLTQSGWSAVSTTDKIKIGTAPVTGYLQADAGFWCIATEHDLTGLFSLNGRLYIGGNTTTYALDGVSYDTYILSPALTGISAGGIVSGVSTGPCIANGYAYFWFGDDLYEYNGGDHCKPINRPVLVNGQVSNGIYGGIDVTQGNLASDGEYLYLFFGNFVKTHNVDATYYVNQFHYYAFHLKSRTWWLRAGPCVKTYDMTETYPSASYNMWFLRRENSSGLGSVYTATQLKYGVANVATWRFWLNMGTQYTGYYYSHIVTKAFNDDGSDDTTLTEINILCRSYYAPYSDNDAEDVLKVYYQVGSYTPTYYLSNTSYAWNLLKTFSPSDIPDDLAVLSIPLVGSEIARAKSYMLKFEWMSENELEIFSIERRFRTIGRSR